MAYALCITSNAWSVRLDTWRSHSAAHAASGGGADRTTEPLAAEAALGGGGGAHKGARIAASTGCRPLTLRFRAEGITLPSDDSQGHPPVG